MDKPEIEWITAKEAAVIMGVHLETVRRLCRTGKLECRQHTIIQGMFVWEVAREAAENYERDYGGRPHK